jgi:hypothetical protein
MTHKGDVTMTTLHTEKVPENPSGFIAQIIANQERYQELEQRYDPPQNKQAAGLWYIFQKAADQAAHDLQHATGNLFEKFQARLNAFDHRYSHADKATQLLTIIEKLEPYAQDFVGTDSHPIEDDRDRKTVITAYWHAANELDDLVARVYRCTRQVESYGSTQGLAGPHSGLTYKTPSRSRDKALEIVEQAESENNSRSNVPSFAAYRDAINRKVRVGEYLRDKAAIQAIIDLIKGRPDDYEGLRKECAALKAYQMFLYAHDDETVQILSSVNISHIEDALLQIDKKIDLTKIDEILGSDPSLDP